MREGKSNEGEKKGKKREKNFLTIIISIGIVVKQCCHWKNNVHGEL
jgi:hypothetical protein